MNVDVKIHNYLCTLNPILDITSEGDVMRYADAITAFGYADAKDHIPELRRLLQVAKEETVGMEMVITLGLVSAIAVFIALIVQK